MAGNKYLLLSRLTHIWSKALQETSHVLAEMAAEDAPLLKAQPQPEPRPQPQPQIDARQTVEVDSPNIPQPGTSELLSVEQAARILGVSRQAVWQWARKGHIRATKNNNDRLAVPRSEIERLIAEQEANSDLISASEIYSSSPLSRNDLRRLRERRLVKFQRVHAKKSLYSRQALAALYPQYFGPKNGTAPTEQQPREAQPHPEQSVESPPPAPRVDELRSVEEEVQSLSSYLHELPPRRVAAQIAVWAGHARRALDAALDMSAADAATQREHAERVLQMARQLASEHNVFVAALHRDWEFEDWKLYVRANQAVAEGRTPDLDAVEQEALVTEELKLALRHHQMIARDQAQALLDQAGRAGEKTPLLLRAEKVFSNLLSPPAAETEHEEAEDIEEAELAELVPPGVLAVTRGKRALIIGGQGARPEHKDRIVRELGFKKVEWIVSERGAANPFRRVVPRANRRNYDMAIFLASYTSHKSAPLIAACKRAGLPLAYLPRGYSLNSVVQAVADQIVPREEGLFAHMNGHRLNGHSLKTV